MTNFTNPQDENPLPTAPGDDADAGRAALSRRGWLGAVGAGLTVAGADPFLGTVAPAAAATTGMSPTLWVQPGTLGMPPVTGLHLQFGADASREMVVSWQTLVPVQRPRVLLGTLNDGIGTKVAALTDAYTDAQSGQSVYVHSARFQQLHPDSEYVYAAVHDGLRVPGGRPGSVDGPQAGTGEIGAGRTAGHDIAPDSGQRAMGRCLGCETQVTARH
ncbi:fibronectin type III domain-containing protein [Frankia sp. Cas3]|uniref:fibronectin type III domain-containing protein n=1 Tax=Frankia sp. Cas3 TaxID=3073926 RepID=UPI002AD24D4E|nr:fibronectin type III domain-containing protein [Frankia sp. Cas3]